MSPSPRTTTGGTAALACVMHSSSLPSEGRLAGGSAAELRSLAPRTCVTSPPVTIDGFAAAVVREEGAWKCSLLAEELLEDLDAVITALRRLAANGAVFGLL